MKERKISLAAVILMTVLLVCMNGMLVMAAPSIEPGDENYIRVGGEVWICHYAPAPEPQYGCDILPDGTFGPMYIIGYSNPSDAAEGFVRADYTASPIYKAFRNDLLNGIALNAAQGKTGNIIYYGQFAYDPDSEAEYVEYKNIAENVIVDLIKEGVIRNGYASVTVKKNYDEGVIYTNATHLDTQIVCWMIDGEMDEAQEFFAKYPFLKPYYKSR